MALVFTQILIALLLFTSGLELALAETANELTVVSQNLNRFFDDRDDGNNEKVLKPEHYQKRLNQLVTKIVHDYKQPDLLMFQEVENINILRDICKLLVKAHRIHYQPFLIEGNDSSGIDVGYLVKDSWRVNSSSSMHKNTTFKSKNSRLFSRPPLVIELCSAQCITVMNLHLRSMRGLRSKRKGKYTALKRRQQAETIARWIQQFQGRNPSAQLIVAGDFNALTPSDPYVDVVGTIKGNPDAHRPRWKSADLVSRDLIDVTQRVSQKNRFSFKYKGRKQQLDYLLISSNLVGHLRYVEFTPINYHFSDHAAVSASFEFR